METIQINVYPFAELDPKVQAKVLDKFRGFATDDYDWAKDTLDYYKTDKASERCFNIQDIFYSGFSSQGDGASWHGTVKVLPWLEKNQPDSPLLKYREAFEEYCTEIRIAQGGHYCHHKTMSLADNDLHSVADEIIKQDHYETKFREAKLYEAIADLETAILKDAQDFAQEIYSTLEQEYTYQTSDEAVKEYIEINEYKFFADGRIL